MAADQSSMNGTCGDQANVIIPSILRLTAELSRFASFEPNPSLDQTLSGISHLCHQTDVSPGVEDQILNDPRIISILPKLRDLWANAAGALEDSWASKILSAAKELLASYPRLRNYKATVPLELGLISIVIGSFPSSIAMLGSGPLPLTSLSVMDFAAEKGQHGMRILNIDVVPERIRSSKKIFSLLGEKYKGVSHQVADAAGDDLADLSHCDAVYVASLIGNSDEDKIGVLRNTAARMRKGAVLVVRSSSGLSRLLWPSLQNTHFRKMVDVLEPTLAAQPLNGPTKHSVLVLKVVA